MVINYLKELQPYLHKFHRMKLTDDKLIACSPFREDNSPSFAVNLNIGTWVDSGAINTPHKGGFTYLLALLSDESELAIQMYLEERYSPYRATGEHLELSVHLQSPIEPQHIPNTVLEKIADTNKVAYSYLQSRGIGEGVAGMFDIGYFAPKNAIAIPWRDKRGNLVICKYRNLHNKAFYYGSECNTVKHHLYGMHIAKTRMNLPLYVVESEIDALSLIEIGRNAVALGGGYVSKQQMQLLRVSGIQKLIVATDADAVGAQLHTKLQTLGKYYPVVRLHLDDCKDVNEFLMTDKLGLIRSCESAESCCPARFNINLKR